MKNMLKKPKSLYKNLTLPMKAAFWYFLCNVVQKCVGLITTPVFTRILSPEDFGLYNVYMSWASTASIFISLRLDFGVFNKGMSKYKDDHDGYVASMQMITTISAIVMFVICFIFKQQVERLTELNFLIIALIIIKTFVGTSYNFWMLRERYEYRYITFSAVVLGMAIGQTVISILAVLWAPSDKGLVRILCDALTYTIVGIILYGIVLSKNRHKIKKEYIVFALLFNLPLIPHYLSTYVLNNIDRIMIQKLVGITETGIYGVAYSVGMTMNIVSSSLTNALTPLFYQRLEERKMQDVIDKFWKAMILVCLAVVAFILLAPEAVWIMAPASYYEAIYIIPPIAASVVFATMHGFFTIIEFFYDRNKFSMVISIIAATVNLISNYIGIKLFGYLAAGFTTLASFMIMAAGHYIYSRKVVMEKEYSIYFDQKLIVLVFIGAVIAVVGVCFLYQYTIARYIVFAALFALAVYYRKMITELFTKKVKDLK